MQKSNICKKCLLVFQASTYYIRRRFCMIHFYCGLEKNDSRSTKLCDCCSSPVISCLNRQSALRHCREKHKKRLVNIPSTSLHFFLLSY